MKSGIPKSVVRLYNYIIFAWSYVSCKVVSSQIGKFVSA